MESGITSQVATTDFLTLLTVQLRNQDPLDPVKQDDFISQLSQFSMLEGIEEMNVSFEDMLTLQQKAQGMDLVGKTVEYFNSNSNSYETGVVAELFVDQGAVKLIVDGNSITIDQISSVKAPAA